MRVSSIHAWRANLTCTVQCGKDGIGGVCLVCILVTKGAHGGKDRPRRTEGAWDALNRVRSALWTIVALRTSGRFDGFVTAEFTRGADSGVAHSNYWTVRRFGTDDRLSRIDWAVIALGALVAIIELSSVYDISVGPRWTNLSHLCPIGAEM